MPLAADPTPQHLVIAGDARMLLQIAPWSRKVLPASWRSRTHFDPGPAEWSGWPSRLSETLSDYKTRTNRTVDAVILVLAPEHPARDILASIGPLVRAVRNKGASLLWVCPPGVRAGDARALEDVVLAAGERFHTSPPVRVTEGGLLVPPSAKRILADLVGAVGNPADTSDLSDRFFTVGEAMCERLGLSMVHLLFAMNLASGVSSKASAPSASGGGVGLLQLSPLMLKALGWADEPAEFATISAEEQLSWVEKYLAPILKGRAPTFVLNSAARVAHAIVCPFTLGESVVLSSSKGRTWQTGGQTFAEKDLYAESALLDSGHTGSITEADLDKAMRQAAGTVRFKAILSRYSALTKRSLPGVTPAPLAQASTPWPEAALAVGLVSASIAFLGYLENRGARIVASRKKVPA